MLMPSALSSCDLSRPPVTRLQSSLFASPPASPPTSPQTAFGTIVSSCRALQSMLAAPPPMSSQLGPLPTPPMSHAPFPPMKMRLRPRPQNANGDRTQRMGIRKRTTPPRGINKRRRAVEDDMGRDDDIDSDLDISNTDVEELEDARCATPTPTTPKRARIAPADLPRGLERSDYHGLHEPAEEEVRKEGTGVEEEEDGERWSVEDDRVLVELICEKLKLSKSEWQECARRVGKSENGVERRWRSLIRSGDIGVKSRARRGKVHGTWG
ncbi:putative DNA-binding protein [Rosellinia necatrix]|uniref:Putative DNA-binding protein n=1 Tax=Rosellinia necatrix TaxID=77044 RepID=A0A1S7UHR0_ROSNE|nr:putative DNA-binding protein [Rosellinia necatrix]